jgi:hypothetical protein
VIAESVELPTKFAKMVVTGDQGRYVIPDLPAVNYSVFVRGYGLVDSPRMRAKPGQRLDLTAVPAPNAAAAAHYYPAIYWYSMLKMPPESFGTRMTPQACVDRHPDAERISLACSRSFPFCILMPLALVVAGKASTRTMRTGTL